MRDLTSESLRVRTDLTRTLISVHIKDGKSEMIKKCEKAVAGLDCRALPVLPVSARSTASPAHVACHSRDIAVRATGAASGFNTSLFNL